ILQLLDLLAQPLIFFVVDRFASHFAHGPKGNAQLVPDDRKSEHQDEDTKDEFEEVHCGFSPVPMRARSRSASIWAAVCAPPSVTICSRTRSRCSIRSTCCAYCALFSAARLDWASICFSLMRIHIRNGAIAIAASGISTQIQVAGLSIQRAPSLALRYIVEAGAVS